MIGLRACQDGSAERGEEVCALESDLTSLPYHHYEQEP